MSKRESCQRHCHVNLLLESVIEVSLLCDTQILLQPSHFNESQSSRINLERRVNANLTTWKNEMFSVQYNVNCWRDDVIRCSTGSFCWEKLECHSCESCIFSVEKYPLSRPSCARNETGTNWFQSRSSNVAQWYSNLIIIITVLCVYTMLGLARLTWVSTQAWPGRLPKFSSSSPKHKDAAQ